jgi:hypothetical protein
VTKDSVLTAPKNCLPKNAQAYPISFDWSTFLVNNKVVIFILLIINVPVFNLKHKNHSYNLGSKLSMVQRQSKNRTSKYTYQKHSIFGTRMSAIDHLITQLEIEWSIRFRMLTVLHIHISFDF